MEEPTPTPTEAPTEAPTETPNPFALKESDASLDDLIYVEDDFNGSKVYCSKFDTKLQDGRLTSKWTDHGFDPIRLLIVEANDTYTLMLRIEYRAKTWMFIDALEVKVEDEITFISLAPDEQDVMEDGSIRETFILQLPDTLHEVLSSVTSSTDVSIRLSGKDNFTCELPKTKKMAINQMIEVFDALA